MQSTKNQSNKSFDKNTKNEKKTSILIDKRAFLMSPENSLSMSFDNECPVRFVYASNTALNCA